MSCVCLGRALSLRKRNPSEEAPQSGSQLLYKWCKQEVEEQVRVLSESKDISKETKRG